MHISISWNDRMKETCKTTRKSNATHGQSTHRKLCEGQGPLRSAHLLSSSTSMKTTAEAQKQLENKMAGSGGSVTQSILKLKHNASFCLNNMHPGSRSGCNCNCYIRGNSFLTQTHSAKDESLPEIYFQPINHESSYLDRNGIITNFIILFGINKHLC